MFSANHRQHLLVAFKNLDESLADITHCLETTATARLFPPYSDTVGDDERARIGSLISGIRAELSAFMTAQRIAVPAPTLSSRHAARARTSLLLAAVMELDAQHAGGYGALSPSERSALDALADRLSVKTMQLAAALSH